MPQQSLQMLCDVSNDTQFIAELSTRCPAIMNVPEVDHTPQLLCNDDCNGFICMYLEVIDFPSICASSLGQYCQLGNVCVPAACQLGNVSVPVTCGALTIVTIKGLSVALLLLTTFIVL